RKWRGWPTTLPPHFFPRDLHRLRAASTGAAAGRNKNGAILFRSSGENWSEGEPLLRVAGDNFLENGAPLGRALRDVGCALAAGMNADRFAHDDLVAATSGPRDEKRIDRRLGHQRQNEWTVWDSRFGVE